LTKQAQPIDIPAVSARVAEAGAPEMINAAVEAALAELQRQLVTTIPRAIDLSDDRTSVLPFDGFDLRAVIEAALAIPKFS